MGQRRLYRSRKERMIAGVAGGLAEYLDVDVSVIRIVWLLTLSFGGGLAYLIACFIIPEQPFGSEYNESPFNDDWNRTESQTNPEEHDLRWHRSGVILIVLGLYFLLRALLPWPRFRDLIPFILISLGLIILFGGFKRKS